MRQGLLRSLGFAAFVSLFGSHVVGQALANEPTVSMAGKRIAVVVGTPVGGGYDAYARLVGRHLGATIEGNPTVIVQNMPGAGSLIATNWLANTAPKDGTAIGIVPTAALLEGLFGNERAQFDARQMNWLGNLNGLIPVAVVWANSPFMTAQDLFTRESLIGASDAGTTLSRLPKMLNSLLGTKFRVIDGYKGSMGVGLAMERGEVVGSVGNTWDSIQLATPHWIRDKQIRVLMQINTTRDPELPDVPAAMEFAPPENREVLEVLFARTGSFGKPFLAPPGVPAPIVATLRQGFKRMLENEEFKREAAKTQLPINYNSPEEMTQFFNRIFGAPKAIIDRALDEVRKTDPK
jgi:tripartite-type tricarboxylate transporter receptor subunit TctC